MNFHIFKDYRMFYEMKVDKVWCENTIFYCYSCYHNEALRKMFRYWFCANFLSLTRYLFVTHSNRIWIVYMIVHWSRCCSFLFKALILYYNSNSNMIHSYFTSIYTVINSRIFLVSTTIIFISTHVATQLIASSMLWVVSKAILSY